MAGYFATWQANLLDRGWNLSELALLVSVSLTLGLVLDIPFGIFADRIGNKKTVLFAFIVFAVGFLVPTLSVHPVPLASLVIMIAIGNALLSGALESWSADLQSRETKKVSTRFFLGLDQFQRLGMISGALTLPFLTSKISSGNSSTWGIYFIVALGVLLVAIKIPDVKHKVASKDLASAGSSFFNSKIALLACGFIFYGFSDGIVQVAFWPKMVNAGIESLFGLGLIQASMSAARMIGGEVWKRTRFIESDRAPTIALLLSAVPFYFFSYSSGPVESGFIWLVRIFLLSLYFPAVSNALQHTFKGNKNRVAILSLMSTLGVIGSILVSAGVGVISRDNEMKSGIVLDSLIVFGAVSSVVAGLCLVRIKR